ncbi:MAG TPA: dTDP-4-dehydrorhamnose 3,5-epimerase [Chryseosolibacter sp.]|nr:dTDP-4-dehydrorhamnose 3,5-epimerase [Chryseosolibacter sp.]
MQIKETGIHGLIEFIPRVFPDERGYFFEFFKQEVLENLNIPSRFPQENLSFSKKGVIRGLHFQTPPFAQGKLVTVIKGRVLDVAVDLRQHSPTFGKVYYCELNDKLHNMLMIPEGFAHGFAALEESIFQYKCTNVFNKEHESGIVWNDPDLKIDWQVDDPIVSEKDQLLPSLQQLLRNSLISR